VDILERDWGLGENIKVGWMGLPQKLSNVHTVYYKIGSADGFISQAVQYLILRRVFVKSVWNSKLSKRDKLEMEENLTTNLGGVLMAYRYTQRCCRP
jgi:hypothetical protein